MTISSVNSAIPAYSIAASNAASNARAAMPTESGNLPQSVKSDFVSLSPEAIAAQRQEQYALKDDPIEHFNKWLANGAQGWTITLGSGTKETLLPENQPLMDRLQALKSQAANDAKRQEYDANIQTLTTFGNQEIFNELSDIDRRMEAVTMNSYLQSEYLQQRDRTAGLPIYDGPEYDIGIPRKQFINDDLSKLREANKTAETASVEPFSNREFLVNLLANSSYGDTQFVTNQLLSSQTLDKG